MEYRVKSKEYFTNHINFDGETVQRGVKFIPEMFYLCSTLIDLPLEFKDRNSQITEGFIFESWMFEGFDNNGDPIKILQPEFEF